MKDFKRVEAWEKAHQLVLSVYETTRTFPTAELYGLTLQIRRACIAIPAHITAGHGRESNAELVRFLSIAKGVANKVEYYLLLAHDLKMMDDVDYERVIGELAELRGIMTGYIRELNGS